MTEERMAMATAAQADNSAVVSDWVVPLSSCTPDLSERIGGKAVGLGHLLSHGFAVPDGFVITTDAFSRCTAALQPHIDRLIRLAGDAAGDQAASEKIQALFESSLLQPDVAKDIEDAYHRTFHGARVPVAVRSSATAEDTADASFAGQQDTYLWIQGVESIKAHVTACWASLFTARAIGYRARHVVPADGLAMGVVVQQMVPAEAAGVMMTLEPTNGYRTVIFIESAFGLGEIVVRGEVEPDRFTVRKADCSVKSQAIGCKAHAYRFDASSGEVQLAPVEESLQSTPSLTSAEVENLARLGLAVEHAFGAPMDIEWAIAPRADAEHRELLLLQARPETVWSNRPAIGEDPQAVIGRIDEWDPLITRSPDDIHWTRSNVGEATPGVQTPLSWTLWSRGFERSLRESAYKLGIFDKTERRVPDNTEDRIITSFYGRTAVRVEYLATVGDRMPGTTGPDAVSSVFGRVPDDIRFAPTKRYYPLVATRFPKAFVYAPRQLRRMAKDFDSWWSASTRAVPSLNEAQTVALLRDAVNRNHDATALQSFSVVGVIQPVYEALAAVVKKSGVGDVSVLAGASGGSEMAIVEDIWRASRGEIDLSEVVDRHGFHGPLEGELSGVVWREDDAPLRAMMAQYANRDETHNPVRKDKERRAARPELEREVLAGLPRIARLPCRGVLAMARNLLPMRGVGKRSYLQAFDVARACARHLGDLLAADGRLDSPQDIFYLTIDELTDHIPTNTKELVQLRRARHAAYEQLDVPSEWRGMPDVTPRGRSAPPRTGEAIDELLGVGVSAGVVEGIARVLLHPDFSKVRSDEVLVAPTTDPSWASIMFVSSALVVDVGGALSHSAVVAREMCIPCVVNTRTGTQLLRSGDRVRVDGTSGIVEILERAESRIS